MKRTRNRISSAACMLLTLASLSGSAQASESSNYEFLRMAYKYLANVDITANKGTMLALEMLVGVITKDDVINMALGDPGRRPFVVNSIYQQYLRRPATAFDLAYWGTGQQNWTTEVDLRAAVMATDEFFNLPCNNFIGADPLRNFTCNVGNATDEFHISNFIEQNVYMVQPGMLTRYQFAYYHLGMTNGGASYCRTQMGALHLYQGDADSLFGSCFTAASKRDEEGAANLLAHSTRFYQNGLKYTK